MTIRNMTEALDYIHGLYRFGSKPGLERISRLLELMGSPQHGLRFIHIAGTNGKGSTAAFVSALLREAHFRTGTYISPYLEDFRERISIDGEMIPPEDLVLEMASVKEMLEGQISPDADGETEMPTEFEVVTALGLNYFARMGVDYVVLEVGLGGRFDATNIIEGPEVAVITNIDLDHTSVLGDTIPQIAWEKAGIIKGGAPVVTAEQDARALDVILERAKDLNSPVIRVGTDVTWEVTGTGKWGSEFNLKGPGYRYTALRTQMIGEHQVRNAATAVAVFNLLADVAGRGRTGGEGGNEGGGEGDDSGLVRLGLQKTRWPGRLELIEGASGQPDILLDGAHNTAGAQVAARALRAHFMGDEYQRRAMVFGVLGDKNAQSMLGQLVTGFDDIIVTQPDIPRAVGALALEGVARDALAETRHSADVTSVIDYREAIERAVTTVGPDGLVFVAGSLYLTGPVRAYLRETKRIRSHSEQGASNDRRGEVRRFES